MIHPPQLLHSPYFAAPLLVQMGSSHQDGGDPLPECMNERVLQSLYFWITGFCFFLIVYSGTLILRFGILGNFELGELWILGTLEFGNFGFGHFWNFGFGELWSFGTLDFWKDFGNFGWLTCVPWLA